jgi:hypothetical protein
MNSKKKKKKHHRYSEKEFAILRHLDMCLLTKKVVQYESRLKAIITLTAFPYS